MSGFGFELLLMRLGRVERVGRLVWFGLVWSDLVWFGLV